MNYLTSANSRRERDIEVNQYIMVSHQWNIVMMNPWQTLFNLEDILGRLLLFIHELTELYTSK